MNWKRLHFILIWVGNFKLSETSKVDCDAYPKRINELEEENLLDGNLTQMLCDGTLPCLK